MNASPPPEPTSATSGPWTGRPAGLPDVVPPPSVPLAFLIFAGAGLVATGVTLFWARGAAVGDPTSDPVVAAVHFGMLATLSMAVLGALHQFTPVVTQRPLRSTALGRATFAVWLAAAWLLPIGFAGEWERLVEAGGACAAVAIALAVANLAAPLSARGKGTPVTGLRLALVGLVVTACYGVVYVADRSGNWFNLSGNVVLAHGIIGIFAWLGLTYVSVAEKLWPMFMLSHAPADRRSTRLAVWALPGGVLLLSPGLLFGLAWLAIPGAMLLAAGLLGHLSSLATHLRHRRRRADLYLVFLVSSACCLPVGAALALAAVITLPDHHHAGVALVAGAIAAFGGWLLIAVVGTAHKVVPFIVWSALRARGIDRGPTGKPLMFGDLYLRRWAWSTYALSILGIVASCIGLAGSYQPATAVGGLALAATGITLAVGLSVRPLGLILRERQLARSGASPATEIQQVG